MGDLLQDLQQAASLQGQVSFAVAPGLVSSGRVKLDHSLVLAISGVDAYGVHLRHGVWGKVHPRPVGWGWPRDE